MKTFKAKKIGNPYHSLYHTMPFVVEGYVTKDGVKRWDSIECFCKTEALAKRVARMLSQREAAKQKKEEDA